MRNPPVSPSPFLVLQSLDNWHRKHFRIAYATPRQTRVEGPDWAKDREHAWSNGYIPMWRLLELVRVQDGLIHFPPEWNQDPVPLTKEGGAAPVHPSSVGEVTTDPPSKGTSL